MGGKGGPYRLPEIQALTGIPGTNHRCNQCFVPECDRYYIFVYFPKQVRQTDLNQQAAIVSTTTKRKGKTPSICQCTDEACKRPKPTPRAEADKEAELIEVVKPMQPRNSCAKKAEVPGTAEKVDQALDAEVTARTCNKCTKVKRAPRGKKF
jgi:hypothetical protein